MTVGLSGRARLVVVAAAAATVVTPGQAVATSGTSPPTGLSASGRVLWNLEGLTQRTFGEHAHPCVPAQRPRAFYNFQTQPCSPLSGYGFYSYVFAPHRSTSFHLSAKNGRGMSFGNYPVPVRIHKRLIACDRTERTFVIEYADAANFSVACLAPLR